MQKCVFLILLTFLSLSAQSADLSATYQEKMRAQAFTSQELSKLRQMKVLIIPGFLAESFERGGRNPIKVGFIFEDAFKEQKRLLAKNKIEYEYLEVDTEASLEDNAKVVEAAIESSAKPVLIYSHSKGSLDTLEALRKNPFLIKKIHGWVTLQAPFWGAPLATMMYDNTVFRKNGQTFLEWMGGELVSMKGMMEKERQDYMEQPDVKDLLTSLSQEIKIVNYASYMPNLFGIETPLELFRNATAKRVGRNDGLVGLKSALMKEHGYDVDFVVEAKVDHLMTMSRFRPDRIDVFHAFRRKFSQQVHAMGLMKMVL